MSKGNFIAIAFLFHSIVALANSGGDSASFWKGMWANCHDVHSPGFDQRIEEFKKYLREGNKWEQSVELEKAEIRTIINKTCVSWAADPNGHEHLKDFRTRYAKVSKEAIDISDKANGYLLPTIKNWTLLMQAECAEAISFPEEEPLVWERDFPCSQSFTAAINRIETRMKEVTELFNEVKKKCPIAADELDIKITTKTYGQGAPSIKNSVKDQKARTGSDISGTQNAIRADKKAKSIIQKK